jgi:hypothetical protein
MGINWSDWKKFNKNELAILPEKEGVYEFRCVDNNGFPKIISRLLDRDPEGIIYIGKSENLWSRINAFWKTIIKRDRSRHAAAWTYCSYGYESLFPPNSLQFRFLEFENPEDLEFDLLLQYFRKYRDLPPLNTSRGNYPGNWINKLEKTFGRKPLKE